MKEIFLTILFLTLLVSCSKTYYTSDLVKENGIRSTSGFKYLPKDNYYITNELPSYTVAKKKLIDSLKEKAAITEWGYEDLKKEDKEILWDIQRKLNDPEFIKEDSSMHYIVSFNEDLKNLKYEVIAIRHWDYANIRFLVPFLPLGNRLHLRNQCVNRAIQECIKINGDGVIISTDLQNSKIIRVIK